MKYFIPPQVPDERLPAEVRAGLRVAARIAVRLLRERSGPKVQKKGSPP